MNSEKESNKISGKPISYWIDSTKSTNFPTLNENITSEVVIIGGGIVGITLAYLLHKANFKVVLLEAFRIVTSVTGNTTAKVTSQHGLIYDFLIINFGKEKAKIYADSNQNAIEEINTIINELNIECDFERKDAYVYTESKDQLQEIEKEVEAATSLGLPASFERDIPIQFPINGAIRFKNQAQFHPRKYLLSIIDFLASEGVKIYENTKVTSVNDGEPCTIETENGIIKAKDVVIATNYPITNKGLYFAKMVPKRSYVLGIELNGNVPEGMFYKSGTPYFSVRTQKMGEKTLVLVGGENHQPGEEDNTLERYAKLEDLARNKFDVKSINYRWSTQDNTTIDRVPYIGRLAKDSKHEYVVTGFGGWGMTNSTVAGLIIKDLLQNKKNPWSELYDPLRFKPITSAPKLVKAGLTSVEHFVGDKVKSREEVPISEIENGEGKIIKYKNQKVAVYKDRNGKIFAVSPICTHLGCMVNFNNAEKSWDCPCHGSRFNYDGKVIHGPAVKDLEPKNIDL